MPLSIAVLLLLLVARRAIGRALVLPERPQPDALARRASGARR